MQKLLPHPRGSYVREETAESDYPIAGEGEWSITAWCASLGIHQHVARALQGERSSSESQVAFIRSLASPSGHDTVIGLLRSGALLERVATEVHRQAQALARAPRRRPLRSSWQNSVRMARRSP